MPVDLSISGQTANQALETARAVQFSIGDLKHQAVNLAVKISTTAAKMEQAYKNVENFVSLAVKMDQA